jgi:F-type H+-transporting ATPase subunit gamma
MSKIHQIKQTIKSTEQTKKITNAMYLVSTSKLGQAQKRMQAGKPYAQGILRVIQSIADANCEYRHPFITGHAKAADQYDVLTVTSNRGLCAGLNSQLFKHVIAQAQKWQKEKIQANFGVYGSKGIQFFTSLKANIITKTIIQDDNASQIKVVGNLKESIRRYLNGQTSRVYIAYNVFHSVMSQEPLLIQLLPLPKLDKPMRENQWDYIYEPDAQNILDRMLERYLESIVYQAIIENFACEQAARMLAMKNASENAEEIICDLKLTYNKARQAIITQEIAEIVSGAASASGNI